MNTIRTRNGETARTRKDALPVAAAVALYMVGNNIADSASKAGVPYSTLTGILGRLGIRRSRAEGEAQYVADQGKVPKPARQNILKRDYTRLEAYEKTDELAEKWGVSRATVEKDRKAVGMRVTPRERSAIRYWGSIKEWHQAQRRAALLKRKRGMKVKEIAEEMSINRNTVRHLIEAFDERGSKGSTEQFFRRTERIRDRKSS